MPVDLKGVPFIAKPDREFLVLKRLSTLHNERLMRRLLNPEICAGRPDPSAAPRGPGGPTCHGKEKTPGARSDPGLHKDPPWGEVGGRGRSRP